MCRQLIAHLPWVRQLSDVKTRRGHSGPQVGITIHVSHALGIEWSNTSGNDIINTNLDNPGLLHNMLPVNILAGGHL